MKYDILEGFNVYLQERLTYNTAKKYYSSVVNFFGDLQFSSLSDIGQDYITNKLQQQPSTKNEFSAIKNGLRQLQVYDNSLVLPGESFFKDISIHKRNRRKSSGKTIYLDGVRRKVNQIKNERLKLAYRLAMVSGLRVSELANLETQDIRFGEDGAINVMVINGKGGKDGIVTCVKDEYVYCRLQEFIKNLEKGSRLFYSQVYMREKANNIGLECHDFRRIYAIMHRNALKKEMPVYEANRIVKDNLRHARFVTTKKYLYGKKLVIKKGGEDGCK